MVNDSNLISAQELQSRIDDPDMRIVDCRFDLADPGAGRQAYRTGHIPGAVFADLDEDLAAPVSPESGRHPLPGVDTLAATLGRLGIGNTTEVVVCDAGNGALAARAWWLLRWLGHDQVRLLDGGYKLWVSSNRPVDKGDETVPVRQFLARPRHDRVLTTAELASDPDAIARMRLFDARDAARFRGEVEPIDTVAGHVPGASNLPFQVSLNGDGTWKSKADLVALWRNVLGDDRNSPWAVMCGSGVTACHLAISATEAGFREPRLYVGSWSEWIRDPARAVGRGEGPSLHIRPADMP
ncbi:MAG: sulfurtransferase [Gammaproteobacteria bacterium]|nr:sulfurtransferase [Gammaproteobacteria bacterium]